MISQMFVAHTVHSAESLTHCVGGGVCGAAVAAEQKSSSSLSGNKLKSKRQEKPPPPPEAAAAAESHPRAPTGAAQVDPASVKALSLSHGVLGREFWAESAARYQRRTLFMPSACLLGRASRAAFIECHLK